MTMVNVFEVESVGDRTVVVRHRAGHRWFFRFPVEGFQGDVPRYAATQYVNDERPDEPFIDNLAATIAATEAQARGWVVTPR